MILLLKLLKVLVKSKTSQSFLKAQKAFGEIVQKLLK